MSKQETTRKIRLLPDVLINRIAAGEVVERPSAVLKELIENSLDAGADRIDIEIEGGGKNMIRVRDNGRGMDRDDLMMSIERHATSKLAPDDSLLCIDTLGFRGEALPSIGSVSHLTIASTKEGETGHEIVIDRGIWRGLKEVEANRGTTVEVARLFYNVPARRKFLKSDKTESAHLLEIAQCYALSRDGLRLTFRDGGREILAVESRHDFKTRVFKVMGRALAENLSPFEHQAEGLTAYGWLGEPGRALRSSSNLYIYVLGRPVRDRVLNRALADGYGRLLPHGHWPAAVVFIDLDPAEVDVNVHPAKAEVRFRHPHAVFSALSEAVSRTVGRAPVLTTSGLPNNMTRNSANPSPDNSKPLFKQYRQEDHEILKDREQASTDSPAPTPPWMLEEKKTAASMPNSARAEIGEEANEAQGEFKEIFPYQKQPEQRKSDEANFEELKALAQIYNSYILAQGANGLYIIDQHAAHERIIFNRLKEIITSEGLPSQSLLFPDTADLNPRQALAAEKLSPHLSRLGFEIQHFGERSFILKSAPAILGKEDPWPPLMEILSAGGSQLKSLEGAGLNEAMENMAGSWLYSLACRAAIKAGDKMSIEAMQRLIDDMAQTANGAYCPHGRPAIQLIERRAIEKRFDRK